jgi:hypothetical protein
MGRLDDPLYKQSKSLQRLGLLVIIAAPIIDAFDPGNSMPQHALGDVRSNAGPRQ